MALGAKDPFLIPSTSANSKIVYKLNKKEGESIFRLTLSYFSATISVTTPYVSLTFLAVLPSSSLLKETEMHAAVATLLYEMRMIIKVVLL